MASGDQFSAVGEDGHSQDGPGGDEGFCALSQPVPVGLLPPEGLQGGFEALAVAIPVGLGAVEGGVIDAQGGECGGSVEECGIVGGEFEGAGGV